MKKYIGLKALLIGGILVLTGCGAINQQVEPGAQMEVNKQIVEVQGKGKDKNRTEIQQVENSKYQSIVWIVESGQGGHGTGFLIGNNKLLTNKHVADSIDKSKMIVRVKNDAGEAFDFKVKNVTLAPTEEVDLAIVEVSPTHSAQSIDDSMKYFELASREEIKNVKEGDAVSTIGYPGDKKEGTLWDSKGKVLMLGGNFLTYDAFISGDNSGSPLFNKDGKIIGLSNASNDETEDGILSFGFLLTDEIYTFIENNK